MRALPLSLNVALTYRTCLGHNRRRLTLWLHEWYRQWRRRRGTGGLDRPPTKTETWKTLTQTTASYFLCKFKGVRPDSWLYRRHLSRGGKRAFASVIERFNCAGYARGSLRGLTVDDALCGKIECTDKLARLPEGRESGSGQW